MSCVTHTSLIESSLELLGGTPDEIANNLFILGYRGRVNDCYNCPLASYLKDTGLLVGKGTNGIKVMSSAIYQQCGQAPGVYYVPIVCFGPHLQGFVQSFDADKYPFLVSN